MFEIRLNPALVFDTLFPVTKWCWHSYEEPIKTQWIEEQGGWSTVTEFRSVRVYE